MEGPSPSKRRKIGDEAREMIAKVYHFLKEEYEFTDLHKEPNADITHLRNITQRTAEATGVCERTVYKILQEEREKLREKFAAAGTSQSTQQKSFKEDKSEESDVAARVNEGTEPKIPEVRNVVATTSKEMPDGTNVASRSTERILVIKKDISEELSVATEANKIAAQRAIKEERDLTEESYVPKKEIDTKEERSSEDRGLPPLTEELDIKQERSTSEESDLPSLTKEIDIKQERSSSEESDFPSLTEEGDIKEERDLSEDRDLPTLTEDVKEETATSEERDLPTLTEEVKEETGTSEERSTTSEERITSEDSNTSEGRETSEESRSSSEGSKSSSEESNVNANGESTRISLNGIKDEDTREESSDIRRRRFRDWS
ncbi:uncharacterized protein LOC118271325 [Spodoptera frugiperda]|uniref:Uncharacterized protein LOC118271325 n=1 Tax=Spodoptera frugiperda TaxID=7108 RepID=A0A9R0ELG4_SPOFR|nr:uncharacterized protein LOC118271325 [Spodoptera frugiperda]